MKWKLKRLLLFFLASLLSACYVPGPTASQNVRIPTVKIDWFTPVSSTPNPSPTPSPQPSFTPQFIHRTATVWEGIPQVPILMYHRFEPQAGAYSYSYTTSLTDFDGHLNALYEAGFSLVSLSDWLEGRISVPEGRRPLIITFDDLFYADQLSLDEANQPAAYSGAGRLWQFSQSHPDFNFHLALFYNFGDKSYANSYTNGAFTVQDGWRQDRAEAIAWGIENGAIPMNHFYSHPFLNQLSPPEIQWELSENDKALREALALVGKESYTQKLPNILALPYVIWPATDAGKKVLFDYIAPENTPVQAIVEGDHASNAKFFPALFSSGFDPWHVPRINATWEAVDVILSRLDEIPLANQCELGTFTEESASKPDVIMQAILAQINAGRCPYGIYILGENAFEADANGVIQLSK